MATLQSTAPKVTRFLPWLGLCFAAAFSFGPARQAAASCGDYVMVGEHVLHGQRLLNEHGVPPTPVSICNGPNCHQQAPAPLGPSQSLPVARNIERACRDLSGDPPGTTTTWLSTDCRSVPCDGYQFRIEHPPRHCAAAGR